MRALKDDGITVVLCERSTWSSSKEGWTLTLSDPVHNHFLIDEIYVRYAERAGLNLFALTNRPGARHGALITITVWQPAKES
jgi:hypothetical protein